MDKKQQDIAFFLAFCIEQYKHNTNTKGSDVQRLFEEHNGISFLIDNMSVKVDDL